MKILHITFHDGCRMQLNFVAKSLGHEITTQMCDHWNYNIGHQRAKELWTKYRDYYQQFDMIITSDTAPLSRIFLQNNYTGKLIIWVSNRFDYYDGASNDCNFPDPEYYQFIKSVPSRSNVKLFTNTPFEIEYARQYRGIQLNTEIIRPCSFVDENSSQMASAISDPLNTFYIPQYHNHHIFMNLKEKCNQLGIFTYYGRYNQLSDLKDIKGIINIPYAYSTISLFENWSMGNVFFIPSKNMLLNKMHKQHNFWFQHSYALESCIDTSEWYLPAHKDLFIYFDSWEALPHLTKNNELIAKTKQNVIQFAAEHNVKTISQWKSAFENWNI